MKGNWFLWLSRPKGGVTHPVTQLIFCCACHCNPLSGGQCSGCSQVLNLCLSVKLWLWRWDHLDQLGQWFSLSVQENEMKGGRKQILVDSESSSILLPIVIGHLLQPPSVSFQVGSCQWLSSCHRLQKVVCTLSAQTDPWFKSLKHWEASAKPGRSHRSLLEIPGLCDEQRRDPQKAQWSVSPLQLLRCQSLSLFTRSCQRQKWQQMLKIWWAFSVILESDTSFHEAGLSWDEQRRSAFQQERDGESRDNKKQWLLQLSSVGLKQRDFFVIVTLGD